MKFHNADGDIEFTPAAMHIDGKVTLEKPIFADDFEFLQSVVTGATPKLTIPSPSMVHYRGGRAAIEQSVYPDMDQFWSDLTTAYADQVVGDRRRSAARTCSSTTPASPTSTTPTSAPRWRPRATTPSTCTRATSATSTRRWRGVPRAWRSPPTCAAATSARSWVAEGGYDFVAEALFNELAVDGFFMEWDDARSGGFEPLRFVPKGKVVVLGLVTTKKGELETKDFLKRRIEEATKYVDLDQLCLSPQCGFSSTVEGNTLSIEQQADKLRLIVEVARGGLGIA